MGQFQDLAARLVLGVVENGGATELLSASRQQSAPSAGFVVGGLAEPLRIVAGVAENTPALDSVEVWLERVALDFAGQWVGSWRDEETGDWWFDVCSIAEPGTGLKVSEDLAREAALRAARQRGEIAIWDLGAGAEIRV